MFENKKVLITGGTGSFGSAMTAKLLAKGVKEVIVFSRDETKQFFMREKIADKRLKFIIGDVRDKFSISTACQGVDYLFHAAALKQVPSCEIYPLEAVKTNILGSQNVIQAVLSSTIEKAIFLSTDKAVYPINSMGLTKAMMERLVSAAAIEAAGRGKVLACVRYGNVVCSRGSVIPLFVNQIIDQHPLTITNGEMTRFLLSLEDAIELVFHAFEIAEPADILIKKAPACTVMELARTLAKLANKEVKIELIGTRHGEKIHETLASFHELAIATDLKSYFKIPSVSLIDDVNAYLDNGKDFDSDVDYSSNLTERLEGERLSRFLQNIKEVNDLFDKSNKHPELTF